MTRECVLLQHVRFYSAVGPGVGVKKQIGHVHNFVPRFAGCLRKLKILPAHGH